MLVRVSAIIHPPWLSQEKGGYTKVPCPSIRMRVAKQIARACVRKEMERQDIHWPAVKCLKSRFSWAAAPRFATSVRKIRSAMPHAPAAPLSRSLHAP